MVEAIEARRDELVALVGDLIAFDTTARHVGDPPRAEADLQAYLGDRLRGARRERRHLGARSPDDVAGTRQVAAGPGLRRPAAARRDASRAPAAGARCCSTATSTS